MALDRRGFLRMLGVTGTSVALGAFSAVSLDDDRYTNTRLGLKVDKPPGWHFTRVRDYTRALGEQIERLEDSESFKELVELSGDPFLVITRERIEDVPGDRVIPTLYAHTSSSSWPLDEDWEEFLRDTPSHVAEFYPDYRCDGLIRMSHLSGFRAGEFRFEYRIGNAWIRSGVFMTISRRADFSFYWGGPLKGGGPWESEALESIGTIELT